MGNPGMADAENSRKSEQFPDLSDKKKLLEELKEERAKTNGKKTVDIFDIIKLGDWSKFEAFCEKVGSQVFCTRDEKGHTPAHWACLIGNVDMLQYICDHGGWIDEPSESEARQHPIHWACVKGHVSALEFLVKRGVALDTTDAKGCTLLMVACQNGQTIMAGYLMGKGAKLQCVDKDGDNALHWAAFKGHPELIRLLVYSGFNPRQKDKFSQTPLHLAAISGDLNCVKTLCEQLIETAPSEDDVELNSEDMNGRTPVLLAARMDHKTVHDYLKKKIQKSNSILGKIDIWTIIFGPPGKSKIPLLFFFCAVCGWGFPMYIIKCIPLTYGDLWPLHWLFLASNISMFVSLYHASATDPGYLPRNIPDYDMAIRQIAHYAAWGTGENPLKRLCHTCRTVKTPRSKHCRICNRCVQYMDHHCPYVYNCVGYNNRASFVIFVTSVFICGTVGLFFEYWVWSMEGWVLRPMYICGAVLSIFFEGVAMTLAWYTILHAFGNVTTNERVNFKRYDHMHDEKDEFKNPYNRGCMANIKEFFYLRTPSALDDMYLKEIKSV